MECSQQAHSALVIQSQMVKDLFLQALGEVCRASILPLTGSHRNLATAGPDQPKGPSTPVSCLTVASTRYFTGIFKEPGRRQMWDNVPTKVSSQPPLLRVV